MLPTSVVERAISKSYIGLGHFSISFAPITAPPTPNAINHQVSIAMASKIANTLTTVKANPSQILVLSLLFD